MKAATNLPVFGSVDVMAMGIFDRFFAGQNIEIGNLLAPDMHPPLIFVKRERRSGTVISQSDDDRFLRPALIAVNTITAGLNADGDGEDLQEACLHALRRAQQEQWVIPNGGSISVLENTSAVSRVSDWATSTGVVQYASLPKGWVRYETIHRLLIRPPAQSTITNPFLSPA